MESISDFKMGKVIGVLEYSETPFLYNKGDHGNAKNMEELDTIRMEMLL